MKFKIINRDTDYAIRALCYMAKSGPGVVSVSQLVKSLSVPRPFLRKILQILSQKKLLKSCKGKGGGFELVRPADNVFLSDLLEISSDLPRGDGCFLGKAVCPDIKTCILRGKLNAIKGLLHSEFKKISIASLIQ